MHNLFSVNRTLNDPEVHHGDVKQIALLYCVPFMILHGHLCSLEITLVPLL